MVIFWTFELGKGAFCIKNDEGIYKLKMMKFS
jgi:hypothetical protein